MAIQRFITNKKLLISLPIILLSAQLSNAYGAISQLHIEQDVRFLSSDELKGRANFTKEIDQAADYLSKRFKASGLQPYHKEFRQRFSVATIKVEQFSVTLNDQPIAAKNIALATTMANFSWQQADDTQLSYVGTNDDLRSTLRTLNKAGGNHLVIIDPSHEATFQRYQHFFQQGLTKLELKHQGAMALVLNDSKTVGQFSITAQATITEQQLSNVVAVLPGKAKANEIVLFSAHYDHIGQGHNKPAAQEGDTIYNGANDDASGTTAILNLANHFAAEANNERTLIFAAFAAEEIGGFGSRYFASTIDEHSIVAMLNIEMIGKPSKFGSGTVWLTGMDRSDVGQIMNDALAPMQKQVYADPYPDFNLFYRSDNATLARLGVPAHSISSTQLDNDKDYHQPSDEFDTLDLKSMHQAIITIAEGAAPLVDGSKTPKRIDSSQVLSHGLIY